MNKNIKVKDTQKLYLEGQFALKSIEENLRKCLAVHLSKAYERYTSDSVNECIVSIALGLYKNRK